MSMLSSNKQVIIIGNDGIVHYLSKGRTIRQTLALSWSDGDFVDTLKESIIDTGRNTPVQLIFDVVEQQYRKETIPSVNPFDKSRVVGRKLRMVYPNHDVRASLKLKQKPKEGKGSVHLFAALPSTREVDMVVEAVLESNVAIDGMMLLPMEGTGLTEKLSNTYFKSSKQNASKWTVLLGHHKTGGIRQIVTRNGELALTRLTPVGGHYLTEGGQVPAAEMIKEFSSTLTYLARFGYMASDGLDLIVVSSSDVAEKFQESSLPVSNLKNVTVGQAFNDLKLGRVAGIDPDDQSSDVLHAKWIAKQRKHLMPLSFKKVDSMQKVRLFARILIMLAFFSMVGLGAYLAYEYTEIEQTKIETQEQKQQQVVLKKKYDEEAKVFDTLEFEPEEIAVVLDVYRDISERTIDPDDSFLAIRDSLVGSMNLESLVLEMTKPTLQSEYDGSDQEQNLMELTITIQFPLGRDTAKNVRETETFEQRLKGAFAGRQVKVTKMPGDLTVDKTVQGISENARDLGVDPTVEQTGDLAEIVIKGEAL